MMRLKVAAFAAACLLPALPASAAEMIGGLEHGAAPDFAMAMGADHRNAPAAPSHGQVDGPAAGAPDRAAAAGILTVTVDAPDDGTGLDRHVLFYAEDATSFDPGVPWQAPGDNLALAPAGLADGPLMAGAVPEPGTWTMLITGFGALGAGLRLARRRRALATA